MPKDIKETISIFQNIKSEIKKTNITEKKMLKISENKTTNQKTGYKPLTEKKYNTNPYNKNQLNIYNPNLTQKNERNKEKSIDLSFCKNDKFLDQNSSKVSKKIVNMYKKSFVSQPNSCKNKNVSLLIIHFYYFPFLHQ